MESIFREYDTRHGHAIKSEEESGSWKEAFNRTFPKGKLRILDVGCGTGELSLLFAEMGMMLMVWIFLKI